MNVSPADDAARTFAGGHLKVTTSAVGDLLPILNAAIERFEFTGKRALEAVLLSPLVIPHFTVGLGFLIIAGIFMAGVAMSPIFMSMAIFRLMTSVCLSPALGCSRSTLRGSPPASSLLRSWPT